jgi:hypothetical protein
MQALRYDNLLSYHSHIIKTNYLTLHASIFRRTQKRLCQRARLC